METITLKWDNDEKTILRYTFLGAWTWDDYLHYLRVGRRMMLDVGHEVCIINDMRLSRELPPNFVNTARNVITSRPANTGLVIFITNSTIFQATYRILARMLEEIPTQYILVSSEEDCYQKISNWQKKSSEN